MEIKSELHLRQLNKENIVFSFINYATIDNIFYTQSGSSIFKKNEENAYPLEEIKKILNSESHNIDILSYLIIEEIHISLLPFANNTIHKFRYDFKIRLEKINSFDEINYTDEDIFELNSKIADLIAGNLTLTFKDVKLSNIQQKNKEYECTWFTKKVNVFFRNNLINTLTNFYFYSNRIFDMLGLNGYLEKKLIFEEMTSLLYTEIDLKDDDFDVIKTSKEELITIEKGVNPFITKIINTLK